MKKIKLFALVAFAMLSTNAFAAITKGEKQTINGVQYEVQTVFANASSGDNTVWVTSNNYSGTALVIPATIDLAIEGTDPFGNDVTGTKTFKVVRIKATSASEGAFENCTSITSVQIGANMLTIDDRSFAGCKNLASITFDAAAGIQTFGSDLFLGTKLTELDLTNTKIQTLNPWFDVNGTLTTVKLPATLTTIAPSAFEDCAALATVDFSKCTLLSSIGNFAFGSTSIATIDFTNCAALTDFETAPTTPFIPTTGTPNTTLTTITLNTHTSKIGNALANLKALTTTNIELTELVSLGDGTNGAFANDAALTTLTLPATCATIATDALKNSSIATLTIKGNATINATGATKLTEITFNGTAAFAGDIKASAFGTNEDLATVTFAKGINLATGKIIGAGAFGSTSAKKSLTTVSLGNVADYDGASIKGGAFVLATGANSTVTIGNVSSTNATKADPFDADPFTGPTADGISAAVSVGEVAAPLANELVSGNISTFEVGDIKASVNTAILGKATTATFGKITGAGATLIGTGTATKVPTLTSVTFGNIEVASGIGALAFAKYSKLGTINFDGKITVAKGVATGAFYDGTNTRYVGEDVQNALGASIPVEVTYSPAHDDMLASGAANREFANDAFAAAAYAGNKVNFNTTRDLGLLYEADYTGASAFFRVDLKFAAEEITIEMAAPEGSSYYYAKFYQNAAYKIAKTQNGENVIVYSAYVDTKDAKIYYDQLRLIDGYYEIPAKAPVIIKSKASTGIIAEGNATGNSLHYFSAGGAVMSEIFYTDAIVGSVLKAATPAAGVNPYVPAAMLTSNSTYNLYALAKISKYGLEWKKFADNAALPDGTIYVRCDKTVDAARLQNVWLDGSEEEATGIKNVNIEKAEDGAIYNLQGVRVNKAAKGLYIKNGKKYIVK